MTNTEKTKVLISLLHDKYDHIAKIDPSSPAYAKLIDTMNAMPPATLKLIEKADIKFLSALARNRLNRRG